MEEAFTPNQVVAYNLRKARELRGWSQAEAAERLEPHLGTKWSPAVWSAAERSVEGKRVREFDAGEIFAFARGFGLSVAWFFLPPDVPGSGWGRVRVPDGVLIFDDAIRQVFSQGGEDLARRLDDLVARMPEGLASEYHRQVEATAHEARAMIFRQVLGTDLVAMEAQLRKLADVLSAVAEGASKGIARGFRMSEEREGGKE